MQREHAARAARRGKQGLGVILFPGNTKGIQRQYAAREARRGKNQGLRNRETLESKGCKKTNVFILFEVPANMEIQRVQKHLFSYGFDVPGNIGIRMVQKQLVFI